MNGTQQYNIFDLGFNSFLSKISYPLGMPETDLGLPSAMESVFSGAANPSVLASGEFIGNLSVKDGYLRSANYVSGSAGWILNYDGSVEIKDLTLFGGIIKYNKTSFTDTTNAGYFISSSGIYFGAAADASKLKYAIADGTFDFIGTVSGRSTLTIATSINVSGQLVTDIVNARLDTSAKQILSDFTFGTSGAIKMITDANNGLWISPTGILGKKAGATTFSITTSGDATFGGDLSAPSGYLGHITLCPQCYGHIKAGQTDYNTGTGFWLGLDNTGVSKFSIGNPAGDFLTWDGFILTVSVAKSDIQVFTSSGTWTKPTNRNYTYIITIGAGGGGGGGRVSSIQYGGAGGGGGSIKMKLFRLADLSSTVAVTIGSAGTGGSVDNNGGNGGGSSFGTLLLAFGGGGGAAGNANTGGGGGASTVASASGQTGGAPAVTDTNAISIQGITSANHVDGKNADYGGASGGGSIMGATSRKGGSSIYGGAGGGGGGGADVSGGYTGGGGGANNSYVAGGGGTGGVANSAGSAGTQVSAGVPGSGGGGGGGSRTGTAGVGGVGGPGSGGGGGGGAYTGQTAAAGGAGGKGEVVIISW